MSHSSNDSRGTTQVYDPNDIRLVETLRVRESTFFMPRHIAAPGCLHHLRGQNIQDALAEVDVYIGSQHGREIAHGKEDFKHCHPTARVFSGSSITHASHKMASQYAEDSNGVKLEGQT